MIWPRAAKHEAFLKRRKQTASSFHFKQKYYLQITAESVGAIGNKWKNRYPFEVLVVISIGMCKWFQTRLAQIAYLPADQLLVKLSYSSKSGRWLQLGPKQRLIL